MRIFMCMCLYNNVIVFTNTLTRRRRGGPKNSLATSNLAVDHVLNP